LLIDMELLTAPIRDNDSAVCVPIVPRSWRAFGNESLLVLYATWTHAA
jgi:hypothetical protein